MRALLNACGFWFVIAILFAVIAISASAMFWMSAPSYAAQGCHGTEGIASYYGSESGSVTASGAKFHPDGMTAAMPSRSMIGRTVRVTDQHTGRSIVVLVNDLGPAARLHRVIDLARGAARRLGMGGLASVCVEIVR